MILSNSADLFSASRFMFLDTCFSFKAMLRNVKYQGVVNGAFCRYRSLCCSFSSVIIVLSILVPSKSGTFWLFWYYKYLINLAKVCFFCVVILASIYPKYGSLVPPAHVMSNKVLEVPVCLTDIS